MQKRSSSGSITSVLPSMSIRIWGSSVARAAICFSVLVVVVVCCLGLGPGLFLRLLMLTAAPPSAEDCVICPGASRLGRREAAVWGGGALDGGDEGATGSGSGLWAGVDRRGDGRVGSEIGPSEGRVEWRDEGRDSTGVVDSAFAAMDVTRVDVVRGSGEMGVERDDSVDDGGGRLIFRGIFVVSVWPFDKGDFCGLVFCFFFFCVVDASAEDDGKTSPSSRFLFLLFFFPVDFPSLAVGELAERFKFARALPGGLNRFLNADPISPNLLAAASASAAARAACSLARASRFSFLASFNFIPRLRTAATSAVGVSPLRTISPFSWDLSRLSTSTN